MQPTILADTDRTMNVRQEEVFGPVLCIAPFDGDDLDSLAAEANDTDYGLNGFIYTRDLSRAHRMARKIKAGVIRVNGAGIDFTVPFGGFKQSGWGREQGEGGVLGFAALKCVVGGRWAPSPPREEAPGKRTRAAAEARPVRCRRRRGRLR